jgi:hypothetical protein
MLEIIKKIEDDSHIWSDRDRVSIEVDLTKAEYALVIDVLRASTLAQAERGNPPISSS